MQVNKSCYGLVTPAKSRRPYIAEILDFYVMVEGAQKLYFNLRTDFLTYIHFVSLLFFKFLFIFIFTVLDGFIEPVKIITLPHGAIITFLLCSCCA